MGNNEGVKERVGREEVGKGKMPYQKNRKVDYEVLHINTLAS